MTSLWDRVVDSQRMGVSQSYTYSPPGSSAHFTIPDWMVPGSGFYTQSDDPLSKILPDINFPGVNITPQLNVNTQPLMIGLLGLGLLLWAK